MKYKITIKHIIEDEFEMVWDDDTIMEAFDKARELATARNNSSKSGRFFVTKIAEVKDK